MEAKPATCDKCGNTTFRVVKIHDGQSERRDCDWCGRFQSFPKWHGVKQEAN